MSEFHLAQANKAKGKVSVDVRQLADAIKTPQTLALRRKLGVMKSKQTTLAKPLEKIVADKVGYRLNLSKYILTNIIIPRSASLFIIILCRLNVKLAMKK